MYGLLQPHSRVRRSADAAAAGNSRAWPYHVRRLRDMASSIPVRADFVIAAAIGIVSATFVASAAPQAGPAGRARTSPAAPERLALSAVAIRGCAGAFNPPDRG